MKLFEPAVFSREIELTFKNSSTEVYMKEWNAQHAWEFKMAQDYVENIRQAQQVASLKAIEEILA